MPGNQDIQSVRRAFDVLEILGNSPDGLPLRHIAGGMHIGKATVHRLMQTMVHRGYVERTDPPVRYRLAAPLRGIRAQQAAWNRSFLTPAMAQAMRLARTTGSQVYVVQVTGSSVIARFRSFRDDPDQTRLPYGWRLMPYGTALLCQAYMTPGELQDCRNRNPLKESDLEYWGSFRQIDEYLDMVRERGLACFVKGGILRATAAVFRRDGKLVGALAIVRPYPPRSQPTSKACLKMLCDAAGALSHSPDAPADAREPRADDR
jgi:IclR family acetate operon transcriptional repressor